MNRNNVINTRKNNPVYNAQRKTLECIHVFILNAGSHCLFLRLQFTRTNGTIVFTGSVTMGSGAF